MSKRTKILIAAALLTAGAVAAISAPGRRGWHHDHDQMGLGIGEDRGGSRVGFFRRGPLSADEIDTQIRERFARIDKNSDGILDTAEIEASLAERTNTWRERMGARMGGRMGERGAPQPGAELLRRFDDNKDGKVTKDEFLGGIKRRFAEADLNNDNRISDDDLPPMMRGRGAIARMAAGEQAPGRFAGRGGQDRGGQDRGMNLGFLRGVEVKDGAITLDAVLAKATAEFERLDRNKDGAIDKADFDMIGKEMADYRVKRFLHMFGADKEGTVTREQFAKVAKDRMARMETEQDSRGQRGWGGRRGEGRGEGRPDRDGDDRRPQRGPDDRGAPPAPKQ